MASLSLANVGGVAQKLVAKIEHWFESIVIMLPNVLLAALILGVALTVSRWCSAVVERIVRRISRNEAISRLLGSISRLAMMAFAFLWALSLLHLDRAVTSVLAGVGVVGLALGFAFQDIAANFMSGFIMALYRPFHVGDMVEVSDRKCRIQRIDLRATQVETLDGLTIAVPNRLIFQNPIINYTRTSSRRMELTMGAAYGDDMEKVRATVLDAVKGVPQRDMERAPELFFTAFADSSINFQLRVWLVSSTEIAFLAARSEAMIAIKKAFDREGITIPFPIRTLDFGAGVVGGERIDAMKLRVVSES